MYNFKANSLSTIVPNTIIEKYPLFEQFMKAYYHWQMKTTITLDGTIGNFTFADYIYGASSQFSTDLEVNVESNESVITEFDSTGKQTFIKGENIFAYTNHSDPVSITLDSTKNFIFNNEENQKVILFRDQTYYFLNDTGVPFYIKDRKTAGANNALTTVTNNGASSGIISIEINDNTPRLLYYTTQSNTNIGTFDIQTPPTQLRVDIADSNLSDISVWGYSRVKELLFHPEYLYHNFSLLSTVDSPNAFFAEYLSQYGLESFFSNNFRSRRAISDFIRFFQKKGTEDAIKFFFRNFFDKDISINYPGELVLKASDSEYFIREQLYVGATPKGIEFTRNRRIQGELSGASAIIEAYQFDAGREFYKLYLNKDKIIGSFQIGENMLVVDDNDSTIVYDTEGKVLGTVSDFRVVEPGQEYSIDDSINNTYIVGGEPLIVTLNVRDITSSSIQRLSVDVPGSGYQVGDDLIFVKPEKKTSFYGIIQPNVTNQTTYTSHNIYLTLYETDDYTLNFDGASVNLFGIGYEVDNYDYVNEVLELNTSVSAPTVTSGNILVIDFPPQNVGDPYYDDSFFHPNSNVSKSTATGYISQVTSSGEIEAVELSANGAGYVVRPTTLNGGISIATVSGVGAEISTSGQGFGGILEIESESDIIGTTYDITVTLQRGSQPTDDDAEIRFITNATSQYGEFFEDNRGFLSDKIFLHDSYYYQDYSYVIESDLNFSDFAELYRNLAHPAGLIFFNQYFIINYFNQKINRGVDAVASPMTITIEKLPTYGLNIDFNLVTLQEISRFINYFFGEQLLRQFHWNSESILTMWNEYDLTYSGVSISGFQDVQLSETTLVPRTFDENPIDHFRTIHKFVTISGTGTVSYDDPTTSGDYSTFFTVSGNGTTFTTETAKYDILNVNNETLMVHTVIDDTNLSAQRINITTPQTIANEPYTITQKRKTELNYANTVDILQFGDINTLGDVDIIDTQVQYADTIFLNA